MKHPLNIDPTGKEVLLYATNLPCNTWSIFEPATHTFIAVQVPSTKEWFHFAYGSEYNGTKGAFSGKLSLRHYSDDIKIMKGLNEDRVKEKISIEPPMNENG